MGAARQLGMQQVLLQAAPRTRDARLQVDHDLVDIDHPGLDQRADGELPRGGIAPRARHQPRLRDLVPVELGQPIDRLGLQVRRRMGLAIPPLIGGRIAQPEIRRQIDDLQIPRQRRDHRLAGGMGQRAEAQIDLREVHLLDLLQHRQRDMAQMRKHLRHLHPRLAVAREPGHDHRGMGGDQPHQLRAGIARGSEDGDTVGHGGLLWVGLVARVCRMWEGMGQGEARKT